MYDAEVARLKQCYENIELIKGIDETQEGVLTSEQIEKLDNYYLEKV